MWCQLLTCTLRGNARVDLLGPELNMAQIFSKSFRKNFKRLLYERYRLVVLRGQVVLDMEKLSNLTTRDSIRVCSLHAVAEEIHSKSVNGNVAELGVYQGEFAKHIHGMFPDRSLYLFDTFQGFSSERSGSGSRRRFLIGIGRLFGHQREFGFGKNGSSGEGKDSGWLFS